MAACWVLLFADEEKIFYTILKFEDCLVLQEVQDKCINWCNVVRLKAGLHLSE